MRGSVVRPATNALRADRTCDAVTTLVPDVGFAQAAVRIDRNAIQRVIGTTPMTGDLLGKETTSDGHD